MNNQLKLLAEQCRGNPMTSEFEPRFDKEKFAKLIVLECSSICYKALENGDEAAILLMNTFGVEE